MTKETYEDGATVTYQYDNNGALATVTDSETGIKTTYCYDLTGRLIKQVESGDGHNFSIEYTMDAQNRVTKYYSIANGDERANFYTYDDDNRITAYQKSADIRHYVYDEFGRVQSERQAYKTSTVVTTQYSFTGTSAQVAAVRNTASGLDRTLSYTYDDNGNILTISDGTNTTSYVYDSANQLIRENNQAGNYTYIWTYDNAGNILSRTEYAYTTGSLEGVTPIDTVTYTYGNSQWGDLLTGYDGRTFSYDAIGNLTNDGIRTYTWKHGRQLATLSDSTTTWQYTYNADGLRTRKTDGATTYSYVYNGGQLTQMTVGTDTLYFSYDATGRPMTVTHNGTVYHYVLSLQGDVLFILDGSENMAASYVYDAWGNTIAGYHSSTLGTLNPLRYRGYVYDTETELYYLQSRYYNPEIGRFTNADLQLNTSLGILGLNLYTYCLNNPVNKADYVGNKPGDLFDTPDEAARDFAEYINAKSIAVNREYASYIYEATVTQTKTITYINPNILGNGPLSWLWRLIFGKGFTRTVTVKVKTTKYTYVEPIQGTKDSCIIPINWFGRHKQVGLLHTHAAYDPLYANDIFSSEDKELAHRRGLPIYVATPIGNLRRFNPFDGTDIILFSDIPFDPNHPWRRWR